MIFKFYLDPLLVPDMEAAKIRLSQYVADMNFILAKNTSRALVFNPDTGIILTDVKPHTDSHAGELPEEFEIWAHAVKTTFISHNGYYGIDQSGAGVLAGLRWREIYDPLAPSDLVDYWRQIHLMLHELAHVFGAGMGEYYNLMQVADNSPAPIAGIDIYNISDIFWSTRQEYFTDPLLWNAATNGKVSPVTRSGLLNYVQYAPLTAYVVSGNYRNGIPTPPPVVVTVRHGQTPLKNARVKVWRVNTVSPHNADLVKDGVTDNDGRYLFDWGANPRNSGSQLYIVKVYKGGYASQAKHVTIWDVDRKHLIGGLPYEIDYDLTKQATFADVPVTHPFWAHVEAIADAGITSGCGVGNFCPDSPVTRGQVAVWLSKALDLT